MDMVIVFVLKRDEFIVKGADASNAARLFAAPRHSFAIMVVPVVWQPVVQKNCWPFARCYELNWKMNTSAVIVEINRLFMIYYNTYIMYINTVTIILIQFMIISKPNLQIKIIIHIIITWRKWSEINISETMLIFLLVEQF